MFVRCTPKNIEKLPCDLTAPFPTTHAPAYLLLGARLVQEQGRDATRWLQRVTDAMVDNYARIDSWCEAGRYSPNKNATEQGLPPVPAECKRVFGSDAVYAPVKRAA